MSCCGKKRSRARQTTQTRPEPNGPVYFQYVGRAGLTVVGARTHNRYQFDRPGAVVATDPRDWRALVGVPTLRQVKPARAVSRSPRVSSWSWER